MNPFTQNAPRASDHDARRATPWQSTAIHLLVLTTFVLSIWQIVEGHGISRWSVGILYALYDSLLIIFTFSQILKSGRKTDRSEQQSAPPSLTVVVACFNEAAIIDKTIRALQNQITASDCIVIADDGSTDNLAQRLQDEFGLSVPAPQGRSALGNLVWLRLDHGGKSCALNQALADIHTDLFITVDADTVLHAGALEAMRQSFSNDPHLVAATGILRPFCPQGPQGRFFEFFQRYEYMRNYLSRSAWARIGTLMLLSGAFSAYRTEAVKKVGGFDIDCIVEDYELTHRLLAYSSNHGLNWQTSIVGQARATTIAPGTTLSFLAQRRRWFSGFLQTHLRYRYMVGNPAYGRVGTVMLPVKAVDTLQPLFGMTGFLLLLYYGATANGAILKPILIVIACKLVLDLAAVTASLFIFDRWAGDRLSKRVLAAWVATSAEPFLFQPLRHLGAIGGWIGFLSRDRRWKQRQFVSGS